MEEAYHETAGVGRDVGREEERVAEDALVHGVDVLVVEWGEAGLCGYVGVSMRVSISVKWECECELRGGEGEG